MEVLDLEGAREVCLGLACLSKLMQSCHLSLPLAISLRFVAASLDPCFAPSDRMIGKGAEAVEGTSCSQIYAELSECFASLNEANIFLFSFSSYIPVRRSPSQKRRRKLTFGKFYPR